MITPKSLKRLKIEKMVVGEDECAEEIQYFDWNWHILSRAKKSYEICKSIDYTSSTFPRRTQWWLWQLKSCFSPACWILHISGALIYYLFNGRILSEASFISQMEGSIKKKTNPGCSIQTWRKTFKDILQTLQQSLGHGTSKTRGKNAE